MPDHGLIQNFTTDLAWIITLSNVCQLSFKF